MPDAVIFIKANWQNLLAVSWFLLSFTGYVIYASKASVRAHGLSGMMHIHRLEWMQRMLERETRVADTTTIANLERSVAFFASTTMLVLAGLITVLGSTEKAIDLLSDIPFATALTSTQWEMKLLLLVALFIYAFFRFTWSLRQYGFTSVMIGATPMPTEKITDKERAAYAIRAANMMSLAANSFNSGLRTYYFSIAVLGWFINPWIFMLMSTGVMLVLYRREFKSRTLRELMVSRSE